VDVWNAFCKLSARRPVSGFGSVGAIPYTEITAYLDLILYIDDPEEQALFIELVDHLDSLFLKNYAEKQRVENEKSKNKSSSKRSRT
jgi:hypothetical protein